MQFGDDVKFSQPDLSGRRRKKEKKRKEKKGERKKLQRNWGRRQMMKSKYLNI